MTKLLIIFQSSISKVDSSYYGKEIFINYFYELGEHFDFSLLTYIMKKRAHFHSIEIDRKRLPNIIGVPIEIRRNIFKKYKLFSQSIKDADVVMIFMPTFSGLFSTLLCCCFRKKYVLYLGTDWRILEEEALKNRKGIKRLATILMPRLKDFLLLNAFKHCMLAVVTGGRLRRKYENYCKVFATKPIINLNLDSICYRKNYELHNPIRLLFVGALFKRKGVHDLIKSLKLLPAEFEYHLDIIGDGPDADFFKNLTERLGLSSQISFLGFIENGPELFDVYKHADIFILPSYLEGFPRVVYEAFYYGVPVITTIVGGIDDLLEDKTHALFIKQRSPEDIAKKIIDLYKNRELRNSLAQNGYKLIEEILSEPASQQHTRLIKEALSTNK